MASSKFIINKGMDNEFLFKIKASRSLIPAVLIQSDSFSCKLYLLSTNAEVATLPVSIFDGANGIIKVIVSSTIANGLIAEFGDKSDGYYPKALYKMIINCNTSSEGKFPIKIRKVHVE